MKIATIIVRILVGLIFAFFSIAYFLQLFPVPELKGDMKTFNEGMAASGYLMNFIKVTELLCGIALLSGRFAPLAIVIIFPITLNIFFVHLFLSSEGLPIAIFLLLANLFLAYAYRKNYVTLVAAKPL